jgi:hypothetical protein
MTDNRVSRFGRREHPADGMHAASARGRVLLEVGAVATAAGFALALLIFDVPQRQRADLVNARALDSCAAIYDRGACECALRASGDDSSGDQPRAPATSGSAAQSASIEEPRARRMNAFVHFVQACMAHGDGAPLD